MPKQVLRLGLIALLFAAIETAVAHEQPITRPAPTTPVFESVYGPHLVADGNPIPWPKAAVMFEIHKALNPKAMRADGNPIPWPKTASQPEGSTRQIADGNPIPWPK